MGLMFDEGIGGPKDLTQARFFYKKACKANIPRACNNLGDMWAKGIGGERSIEKAKWYFKLSCNKNGKKGCANLAVLAKWEGDHAKARALRHKACNSDDASSCAALAWYWTLGWGGPRNLSKANALIKMACEKGHKASCKRTQKSAL